MSKLNKDCWQIILSYTNDPWVFKRTYLTCQLFVNIYNRYLPHLVRKYTNHLWILLEMFPDNEWDWKELSRYSGISLELLRAFPDKPWRIDYISNIIDIDTIINNPEIFPSIEWRWNVVSARNDITWEIVSSNPHIPWDESSLIRNYNIPWSIIEANMDIERLLSYEPTKINVSFRKDIPISFLLNANAPNKYQISTHPDLTWEIINQYPKKIDERFASNHPNITWEIIRDNLNYNWSSEYISANPNISDDIILNNPEPLPGQEWHWVEIICNLSVSIDFILEHCPYDWKYTWISSREDITWDVINNYIDKRWDWYELSYLNIEWEGILSSRSNPWNWEQLLLRDDVLWDKIMEVLDNITNFNGWEQLSMNTNFTWDYILNNPGPIPGVPWSWEYLSYRNDLTWEIIAVNPHLVNDICYEWFKN